MLRSAGRTMCGALDDEELHLKPPLCSRQGFTDRLNGQTDVSPALATSQ
jgi:hypothetical protein